MRARVLPMLAILSVTAGAFALVAPGTASAGGEGWTDDLEAAQKTAKAEGKDLLLDFTGSDWCIWCQRLKEEVFDVEAFRADAKKQRANIDPTAGKQLDALTKEALSTPKNLVAEAREAMKGYKKNCVKNCASPKKNTKEKE